MFNRSIAYRLSIFISLAVIGVFLVFIIATFLFNQQILRENIENKAIGLSSKVNMEINGYISSTRELTQNVSEQVVYYARNGDTEELLSLIMEEYSFLNAIHVSLDSSVSLPHLHFLMNREGNNLQFQESDSVISYCNTNKDILNPDNRLVEPGWSEPYRCLENNQVIVSFYCPVWTVSENGEKIQAGIVISELSLSEINETINQMEIGKRGYAFLVNKKGKYITHPRNENILKENLFTLPSDVIDSEKINISEILSHNKTGSVIAHPRPLNFEKSWVYYTPTNENRWFLIFIMPYHELFQELYILIFRMLFFSVAGIIVIFFIITYISKRLIEPLSLVTRELDILSRPPGKKIPKVKTLNEVKQVSDSLNYLKSWFEKYRIAQSREELQSSRRKQDLQQASEIQQSLIKTHFPAFPERDDIDLYALFKPARVVSGDLFDYFFVDDDNLVFTIGDVSGKGIPAAIFMSIAQTIIKNNASFKKASNIVKKANQDLFTSNQHQFFLTLFLGILNLKKGKLNYCNAAHTIPYILKPNGKIIELNQSHGLPLGLYPEKQYRESRIKLEPGDKIILYTDGVNELVDENKEYFGIQRFKDNLRHLTGLSPENMVNRMEKSLEIYKGEASQTDDICIFVLAYKP